MSKAPPSNDDDPLAERLLLGRVIAAIRDQQGLTQLQAAERAKPPMTAQNWGMHETGKVAGIEKKVVLKRIADALGVTIQDIEITRDRLADYPTAADVARSRMRTISHGLADANAPGRFGDGQQSAVFPLSEGGQAVLTFPATLSDVGYRELAAYLSVFFSTRRPGVQPHPRGRLTRTT